MKQILKIGVFLVVGFLISVQTAYAAHEISALDTIVNFGTKLEAVGLESETAVNFKVVKPDASVFSARAVTDSSGYAMTSLPENETREAGTYKVYIEGLSEESTFKVFPGDMSVKTSGVYVNKTSVAANGADYAQITVKIVDEFGNPLESHRVKLVSSRADDRILKDSLETDDQGLALFLVSSLKSGVSTFTVSDQTADQNLERRVSVDFYAAPGVFKSVGGDPETVLLAQAGQAVTAFSIDNLTATANINEMLSFTVKAVDSSGAVVPGFAGTVLFFSTDVNSQLPSAYSFLPSDQGRKTFDLVLSFRTPGQQKLTVQQQGNSLIKGERTVQVVSNSGGSSSGQVRITKPATGTYAVNTLQVAGEATPNSKVKIFDNGQQKSEVTSDSTGRFSFNTNLLQDGRHTFYAQSNGVQSDPVTVTIDSTPARVEHTEITNKQLAPGDTTEITIRSDPDLTSIEVTVGNDFITKLEPNSEIAGLYSGTLTAPDSEGDYSVNVSLTDKLGNVTPLTEVGKIHVDASLKPPPVFSFNVPSKVKGVTATAWNSAISLSWEPATAEAGIVMYRILCGTSQTKLDLVTNTKDNGTAYLIDNLKNGTTYYCTVLGIDGNGNPGDNRSDIVSATPSSSAQQPPDSLTGGGRSGNGGNGNGNNNGGGGNGGSPVLCEPGPCPPDAPTPNGTPQDGPEVLGLVLAAVLGSSAIRFLKKK